MDQVTRTAVERAEQMALFLSTRSIKVAGRESGHGPTFPVRACSGTSCLSSKHHGQHALWHDSYRPYSFYRAGAFHVTKPSDLIPELQGRLPIRVETAIA